jgi:acetolactate synthase-1/2/3 large subunit
MIRVADYIFKYLADYGIKHVFLVTGGGSMFLNEALRKETRIKYVCNHHEQASAIAAEGYARTSGKLAVVSVTSGPGGTNTLTGVLGQWADSVPVLYISGQVKFKTTLASASNANLRQLGDQEINIIDIVKPITKYAKMITDPKTIKEELKKAIFIATSGRPGPVWLDIPLDVQGALIDENALLTSDQIFWLKPNNNIYLVIDALKQAKRPLIIAGHGIRIAKAKQELLELIELLHIPVVTTFNGFDLIQSNHNNFIGRIGTLGSRAGNFALQNADLIICLGTRNNIRQVSYDWKNFAKNAKKIIIDIDSSELKKPTIIGDIRINTDVKDFIEAFLENYHKNFIINLDWLWLLWCQDKKKKYPVILDEYRTQESINPYYFIEQLTTEANEDAIIIAGNGTACVTLFQAGIVKKNQRIFWNSGCAAMGYDLPAAIGAAFASNKSVICLAGDGSLQMNLQELQTVKHHNLPIKLFVLNNSGYQSIYQTQNNLFEGNLIGCTKESGVSFPSIQKLAKAYDLKYCKINSTKRLNKNITKVLNYDGPVICEVILSNNYIFAPKLSSQKQEDGTMLSQPLENMFPFLSKEELKENMINV